MRVELAAVNANNSGFTGCDAGTLVKVVPVRALPFCRVKMRVALLLMSGAILSCVPPLQVLTALLINVLIVGVVENLVKIAVLGGLDIAMSCSCGSVSVCLRIGMRSCYLLKDKNATRDFTLSLEAGTEHTQFLLRHTHFCRNFSAGSVLCQRPASTCRVVLGSEYALSQHSLCCVSSSQNLT